MDFSFRDDSLNARNAFQAREGTRTDAAVHAQSERHAAEGAHVVLAVRRRRVALRLGEYLRRDVPGHRATAPVRRPSDRINFNGRIDHALNKSHTLRGSFQQNGNDQRNLGVGSYRPRRSRVQRAATIRAHAAAVGKRAAGAKPGSREIAAAAPTGGERLACRARSADDPRARRVHGRRRAAGRRTRRAPRSSGPPTSTGRDGQTCAPLRARSSKADAYRSDSRTNYLGTYTFASLADYEAGRPSTYHAARSAIRWSNTRSGRPASSCRTTGAPART